MVIRMQKEAFKLFVRKNPQLISYVQNNKMTWQQFYEIYDLYGEDSDIWNNFKENISSTNNTNFMSTMKDLFGLFKGIDLNSVQKTLTSLDKAIEAFKGTDLSGNNTMNNYQERPKYKYFED